MEKKTYIIGHKNPDTDSVVSAVAYTKLKELMGFKNHFAARAGHLNPQTDYILKKFNVPSPEYLPNLTPKVEHFMPDLEYSVKDNASVWSAIGKMEDFEKVRVIPVTDQEGHYHSILHYSHFTKNLLSLLNPVKRTPITTSVGAIAKTLNAQPIVVQNEDEIFKASILVGAAHAESFAKKIKEHENENIVVITSDRESIHELCINAKIKLLILSSNYVMGKELRQKAQENGVSVLISPYPVAATSMMIAYSTPVSVMSDKNIPAVHAEDTINKIRPALKASPCHCLPVVDDDDKLIGLISEHDLNMEPKVEAILVDHNELTQACEGIENIRIQEIIDHHRLGNMPTKYPITFINKPIGSTSTLITLLYQENKISIPQDIASILLCGIMSDTLILQSTTTTDTDRDIAEYLSNITNLDYQDLGKEILEAGSRIAGRTPESVVHQDMKEYTEGKLVYTISQIEVGNTNEILSRKNDYFEQLEIERKNRKALFAALLVTDITQLSSVLLIDADEKFENALTFQKMENRIFYLKDVVSRKKQLVPMITEQIANAGL
ncbi:MAG: putative manganese-dependent inorganic diphosphatase [Treponema sp.]|nr:putative manganese-dependent inorganic diphosphatase [Treponema sp.]